MSQTETETAETVIQCVVFFYGEGDRVESPRKKHKCRVKVKDGEIRLSKLKERIW